jgi:hypothetical protein
MTAALALRLRDQGKKTWLDSCCYTPRPGYHSTPRLAKRTIRVIILKQTASFRSQITIHQEGLHPRDHICGSHNLCVFTVHNNSG